MIQPLEYYIEIIVDCWIGLAVFIIVIIPVVILLLGLIKLLDI